MFYYSKNSLIFIQANKKYVKKHAVKFGNIYFMLPFKSEYIYIQKISFLSDNINTSKTSISTSCVHKKWKSKKNSIRKQLTKILSFGICKSFEKIEFLHRKNISLCNSNEINRRSVKNKNIRTQKITFNEQW